ncbi:peptidoglycan binding protein CsiV [Celerinatantimonas yamalensis]|uniref:Peptidoglycan binding protein CsiV n=1 Tax=Celerinatantimonas yamalensis TaxID=559956 RepID=A0ABW9G4J5_9GAMM
MLKPIAYILIALVSISTPIIANAQSRSFDIEVIIFKRHQPQPTGEYWDQTQQKLSIHPTQWLLAPLLKCQSSDCVSSQAVTQIPTVINGSNWPVQKPTSLQMLPSSQFKLNTQWQRLSRDTAFTPLIHLAWREKVPSRSRAIYLGIMAGKRLPNDLRSSVNAPYWQLQGGIKISLQHYLYIDSQLLLTEVKNTAAQSTAVNTQTNIVPNSANTQPLNALVSYKFDQKIRVRSGEIHYFDHPKMGMLIQIRKIPGAN